MTVAEVVAAVEKRIAAYIAEVQRNSSAQAPDTNAAVAWAVRVLGGTTAALSTATDNEVSALAAGREDALVELSHFRVLQDLRGNYSAVTNSLGGVSDQWNDLDKRLKEMIEAKRQEIAAAYGHLLALDVVGAGVSSPAPSRWPVLRTI